MAKLRPIAVFKAPTAITKLIFKIRAFIVNLLLHPEYFAAIVPAPATVTTNVDGLEKKQANVTARIVGAAGLRNIILKLVNANLHDLIAQVQSLADNAPNYDTAVAIIQTAGLGVKVNGVKVKAPFAVSCRKGFAGIAYLAMKAIKKGSYDWQVSYDLGVTWTPLPGTRDAKTTLAGLKSGAEIMFQGRANAGGVAGKWFSAELIVA